MKICCILNIAPSYRKAIYALMRDQLGAEMYFGDHSVEGIAQLRTSREQELHNIYRGKKLIWQRRAIRRAFSKKYDLYILTGNAGIRSNWIIALIARLLGRKVYLWSHGLLGNENASTLRKNMAYMKLAGNALVYGERAQKLLAKQGFTNTTVIYNSLDYDTHLKVREKVGDNSFLRNYFGNDNPVLCYIGRLTSSKKLDMLLRAVADIECNLVIVGGGAEEENLKQLAATLNISDKIWFYGESYDETFIGTLLMNCAVTVSPGSIGLTAIHSLTFGTPVVTHDHIASQMPEAEALTAGVTGFFYKHGDQQSLHDKIIEAIDRPKPVQECHEIISLKYNPAVQIEIMKQLFGTEIEQ